MGPVFSSVLQLSAALLALGAVSGRVTRGCVTSSSSVMLSLGVPSQGYFFSQFEKRSPLIRQMLDFGEVGLGGGKGILSALQMHQTSVPLLPQQVSEWGLCVHTAEQLQPLMAGGRSIPGGACMAQDSRVHSGSPGAARKPRVRAALN